MTQLKSVLFVLLLVFVYVPVFAYGDSMSSQEVAALRLQGQQAILTKNYSQARKLLLPLALMNDTQSAYQLANLFANARGGPQNHENAFVLYYMAAKQQHPDAQTRVANYFSYGNVVPKNFVKAYQWYTVASSNESPKASYFKKLISRNMNEQQILAAKNSMTDFLHDNNLKLTVYPN